MKPVKGSFLNSIFQFYFLVIIKNIILLYFQEEGVTYWKSSKQKFISNFFLFEIEKGCTYFIFELKTNSSRKKQ